MTEINWKELYESACNAIQSLEREIAELKQNITFISNEKKQWEAERFVQQNIIHQAITSANAKSNEYLEENRKLKDEIYNLKARLKDLQS